MDSESEIVAPRDTGREILITELEKAREFPWNDVAKNLNSTIETRLDQSSSGHRCMCHQDWATPGCCAGFRYHSKVCRMRLKRTLANAKARLQERSEQHLDQLQKRPWSSNSLQRWCSKNPHHLTSFAWSFLSRFHMRPQSLTSQGLQPVRHPFQIPPA